MNKNTVANRDDLENTWLLRKDEEVYERNSQLVSDFFDQSFVFDEKEALADESRYLEQLPLDDLIIADKTETQEAPLSPQLFDDQT